MFMRHDSTHEHAVEALKEMGITDDMARLAFIAGYRTGFAEGERAFEWRLQWPEQREELVLQINEALARHHVCARASILEAHGAREAVPVAAGADA